MADANVKLEGPDFSQGVLLENLNEGALLAGHAHGEKMLLARQGGEVFALGAHCTHYGAPLVDGLLVGDSVRCPWHHACFSLRSGEVLRAPALSPVGCWKVELRDGMAYVREKLQPPRHDNSAAPGHPQSIIIIGAGGAGNAAAEMLRQLGFSGRMTLLSADAAPPYDRPNLSKGVLSGASTADFNPPHSPDFYKQLDIELRLNARVTRIDPATRQIELEDGSRHGYDALLLATGADPVRLDLPGAHLPHVHYLRTLADCEALLASAKTARRAVVIGASFIGLEVAASLRARNIDVHVVGREAIPMEKVLGPAVGNFIRRLHEQHGVSFHLENSPLSMDASGVNLQSGERLDADLVVIGVGVKPNLLLAQQAGLAIDRGVIVNEYLETSLAGIYAAGDIARWPDPLSGQSIRVEHWALAQRQGQTAARNMLGMRERFNAVPFFWTEQYDFTLSYIGHAENFDAVAIDGKLEERDCEVTYSRAGKKLAVAVISRDRQGLRAEVELEGVIAKTLAP